MVQTKGCAQAGSKESLGGLQRQGTSKVLEPPTSSPEEQSIDEQPHQSPVLPLVLGTFLTLKNQAPLSPSFFLPLPLSTSASVPA